MQCGDGVVLMASGSLTPWPPWSAARKQWELLGWAVPMARAGQSKSDPGTEWVEE